jgi:hypothetical protein
MVAVALEVDLLRAEAVNDVLRLGADLFLRKRTGKMNRI